ncbi:M1 family metallopeptidase [Sphingomonas bacterium]|uniref:M1 family metallopeptidase n=1 Tax=Sphingomonas bacterium TaxID=1895847 RepID=UPI0020C5EA89|nr:M1 family metallopeptidase [Sphingomonas bacterium]
MATLLGLASAAGAVAPGYDPLETFAPLVLPSPAGVTRSANGLPGPGYWQNRADYQIHARLDPATKTLSGEEVVTYTNNSPDALDMLWLQLDQNIYRTDSRGKYSEGSSGRPGRYDGDTDGIVIDRVEIVRNGRAEAVAHLVSDTRLRVTLPQPLDPKGAKLALKVAWHYTVPGLFGGRTAWGSAKAGDIYDIAQWYPRMAVYDDQRGWDTAPYLAQEFYLDYGDFDYWVTVPASMIVAGSGALQNPEDVLTATERQRLDQARGSDRTVAIVAPAEAGGAATRPKQDGMLTWHYRMENTRDVAWSASPVFAWDAARINLPGGKTSLAMSYYPAEAQGQARWGRSTEYLKDAVERFSARWYPYPWPAAINIAGPATGMEYPGIVFDGIDDAGKQLFWISAHEIGHSWFPMIVGFDERRNAWMDEGFNTFIDTYESDDFNHGEYAPKRDSEFAPGGGNPVDEIVPILADASAPPILARADTIIEKWRHPVTYFKSALGLKLLREEIIGPERFDPAFRRFIAEWAYKHPQPADFFRAMESAGGEDLSWWWRGWYFNNWQMDLAATKLAYVDGDPAKGALVTVESHDKLVMPVTLRIEFPNGTHQDMILPVETWIRQMQNHILLPTHQPIAAVVLDPDHKVPDRQRANNRIGVTKGRL